MPCVGPQTSAAPPLVPASPAALPLRRRSRCRGCSWRPLDGLQQSKRRCARPCPGRVKTPWSRRTCFSEAEEASRHLPATAAARTRPRPRPHRRRTQEARRARPRRAAGGWPPWRRQRVATRVVAAPSLPRTMPSRCLRRTLRPSMPRPLRRLWRPLRRAPQRCRRKWCKQPAWRPMGWRPTGWRRRAWPCRQAFRRQPDPRPHASTASRCPPCLPNPGPLLLLRRRRRCRRGPRRHGPLCG
mmetsp:Transcript_41406/g.118430  ORF Transcript_41406/g.118430 Transcript_41406/m.118430 type:complete len:242 (+) Transcript_41406:931-1656(+)